MNEQLLIGRILPGCLVRPKSKSCRIFVQLAVQWEQYLREDLQTRPHRYEIRGEHGYRVLFV